jgi:hypothetical protein
MAALICWARSSRSPPPPPLPLHPTPVGATLGGTAFADRPPSVLSDLMGRVEEATASFVADWLLPLPLPLRLLPFQSKKAR